MIQAIVFLPLLAALVAGLGQRAIGTTAAKLVTTAALFASCALSWPIFLSFVAGTGEAGVTPVLHWVSSGALQFNWELRVDTLTAVMLVVITTVSALVHLYSWGYMSEDPDQPRFFAYLSLFTFAMLMLVTANNLVQMFFGWEGVGLASYLLIGFWYKKPSANAAAIKAFVVNRVGDLGFMLGIFGTFLVFGTVSIPEILAAATMVTAGVFMVCRLSPMFEAAPVAAGVVTFVGAATCFFAATVGTTQWDIKRVIAYSTCSQLGYMFFAAGVGAYGAAMFHLFTHAFFKALLFLGAGSVIHAMHHEQDMRYYGGLREHIPLTYWAMMMGTLAITGVGIAGVAGFAGFYSKDGILEAAFAAGGGGQIAFWVGIFAALLTSFYSWRLVFLTFYGKPRWEQSEHIQHAVHDDHGHGHDDHAHAPHQDAHGDGTAGYHPHESPINMLIPLGVLSLGAVFAGMLFNHQFIYPEEGAAFWKGSLAFNEHLMHAAHEVPLWVKWMPFTVMAIGLFLAWNSYIRNTTLPARFVAQFSLLHKFLFNKWYFDELYNFLFVKPAFAIGRFFWKRGDEGTIDRFGPNGVAALVQGGTRLAVRLQSGYVYGYAFVMLLGLVGLASWAMVKFQ